MNIKKIAIVALPLLVGVTALAVISSPSSTYEIEPELIYGNPSCSDLPDCGGSYEYKLEPVESGTYDIGDGVNTVTIEVNEKDQTFDWSSTLSMDTVLVKGGPNANAYKYECSDDPGEEVYNDSGLHAPARNGNKYYGLSHISFCYDYELDVTKTAETSYTRTYGWTIDKSVTPATWELFQGDTGTSQYTVSVTKDEGTDSDYLISGDIAIYNPAPMTAQIESITDSMGAEIDCDGDYTLEPGETLVCTYSFSGKYEGATNTATVTTTGEVRGGEDTVEVIFGDPTTVVNDTINVDDTNGSSWEFSESGGQIYKKTFSCDDEVTPDNTATIRETGQSDSASVTVNCYDLTVSKTANTTYTRTWNWEIDKWATPSTWSLLEGDAGISDYTVSVTKKDYTDSNWGVSGGITISNPAPIAAEINVSDELLDGTEVVLTCPYSTIEGNGMIDCTYTATLSDGSSRTNEATVALQNYDYDWDMSKEESGTTFFTDSAEVTFGEPTNLVDDTINVDDGDRNWTFSDTGSQTYSATFYCNRDEGIHDNTATIAETDQSASASVTVDCEALEVTKDAHTSYDRKYFWEIDKWGSSNYLELQTGETADVTYEVTPRVIGSEESSYGVSGSIWIYNPSSVGAELSGVWDILSDGTNAEVICDSYYVAPGSTLECSYTAYPSDMDGLTNKATAEVQNYKYSSDGGIFENLGTTSFSSQDVAVEFNGAVNEIDECVTVEDSWYGYLGEVCYTDLPQAFTYTRTFGPYEECDNYYSFPNTATFTTDDTGDTGSDDWNVDVYVVCPPLEGCTLTYGYWKTHSEYGPAFYDETWAMLSDGADTTFFLSGMTYYEVLMTDASEGPYYQLAHQYIAAELNELSGASVPPEVEDVMYDTYCFFSEWEPEEKITGQLRHVVLGWYEILDDYNNGLIGPGHCTY